MFVNLTFLEFELENIDVQVWEIAGFSEKLTDVNQVF